MCARIVNLYTVGKEDKRESIRRQLAEGELDEDDDPGLSGNNLLLCFLNETPSDADDTDDEEEDLDGKSTKIPANHPLACLADNHEGWESDDSSATENSFKQNISTPGTPAKLANLVEGNISRKKGHVIIPLRCSSEAVQKPKARQDPRTNGEDHSLHLENSFFQQLATIQVHSTYISD